MTATAPALTEAPALEPRERLAAIDVGSNSIRLLVADYDPVAGLSIVDEVKEQPRLSAGMATTGLLSDAAIERAYQALRRMREVCDRRSVRRIAAVATAAVREAENGPDFVRLVREELDIPLRIIDAETEANFSYRSVAHHFPLAGGRTVVADIGGGSLELIGAVDGLVEQSLSLPFGAVRLTELHLTGERDTRREVAALREYLRRQFRRKLPLRDWASPTVIGSGGTFTSLGRMALVRRGLSASDQVHGVNIPPAELEHLLEWLTSMSSEQRKNVAGLNPQRADIILAGLAVTAELLNRFDSRQLTVSAYGLREGLLLEMAGAEPAAAAADPLRLVREFAERCRTDRRHVEQVRHLALLLFDQLGETLGSQPEERFLLEVAALLHDVGQLVSYRRHHKHSYQLIMHAERLNLSARHRVLVALISRYHRGKGPRKRQEEMAGLDSADQGIVRRLTALLRIANGLDRGHTAIVENLSVDICPTRVTVRITPRLAGADLSLECWGATRNADVLAKMMKREVIIESKEPETAHAETKEERPEMKD